MNPVEAAVDVFDESGRPLWIDRDREIGADVVRGFFDGPKHGRVAVWLDDLVDLACALVALQGRAGQMLLIPRGSSREQARALCRRSGSETLITDVDQMIGHGSGADAAADENTRIVIPTSGTTGGPKLVSHTLASLTRTTRTNPDAGGRYRWGLVYDPARFAGLQVFLQSLLGGSTLVLTREDEPLDARIDQLVRSGCNAVSATPTMWRKILMLPQADELSLTQITLGGEIADDQVLQALHRKYPTARVTHIYASTEAGVGFSVNDVRAGFPAEFLERPPNGVEVRVDDDGFLLLRKHAESGDRYVGSTEPTADRHGFVNTGDLVQRVGDRFVFLGRANGAINVGGNKVHPEEVEQVLLMHPAVELARVAPIKSSMVGELVTATVQTSDEIDDPAAFNAELRSFCAERLEPYKVPSMIQIADDIELSAAGKTQRKKP
jgi:acyl-CoA synthetase (AMP-forming)/AMP-acid ligase II